MSFLLTKLALTKKNANSGSNSYFKAICKGCEREKHSTSLSVNTRVEVESLQEKKPQMSWDKIVSILSTLLRIINIGSLSVYIFFNTQNSASYEHVVWQEKFFFRVSTFFRGTEEELLQDYKSQINLFIISLTIFPYRFCSNVCSTLQMYTITAPPLSPLFLKE